MGTFLQTNTVTGGYGYDPELVAFEQFSRELAAFALEDLELPDADMPMLGAASDAAPYVKVRPSSGVLSQSSLLPFHIYLDIPEASAIETFYHVALSFRS